MRPWFWAFLPAVALSSLQACDKSSDESASPSPEVDAAAPDPPEAEPAAESKEAPAKERLVLPLAAANFAVSIIDSPEWPESDGGAKRLGYLRNGAVVEAYDPPVPNDECTAGWYELVGGGYACGRGATIDLKSPRVRLAPKQPDLDAGMPYRYGTNVVDGTPIYRRALNAEQRRKYERRPEKPKPEPSDDGEAASAAVEEAASAPAEEAPPPARARSRETERKKERKKEREAKDPFRDLDGGRPQLKDLEGRGVLVRRMARGFTIALDKEFKAAGARWWRTTFGLAVPFEPIVEVRVRSKHVGDWFADDPAADLLPLPAPLATDTGGALAEAGAQGAGAPLTGAVAFVVRAAASAFELTDDGKGGLKAAWRASMPKRTAVLLTGREEKIGGATYHQTTRGSWVRVAELRLARPQIPEDVGESERWIDIDLTHQTLTAFEGRRPVFATVVSTGRRNAYDPKRDYSTPPGVFRVRHKHVTTTMDADVADGPYSIEDVPWVMYYEGGYALHGTFWHDLFGRVRSHGCVNLTPEDARRVFHWADPQLPPGWHGIYATDQTLGSRIVVHEGEPPPKRW